MEESKEQQRLNEDKDKKNYWRRWGPYLSERQWGTVREDYSSDGNAWDYFPHDHARSRAYRWGEDGIAGISDNHQRLCLSFAFWNGCDPILKERLYGLSWTEGNHGEDVKECYYYLDNTPTHSYMKYLYKYPQEPFPYQELLSLSRLRSRMEPEHELYDTKAFEDNDYFDIFIEFGKETSENINIKLTAFNRGTEKAQLHIIPTLWFRNTWSWNGKIEKPRLSLHKQTPDYTVLQAEHETLGKRWLIAEDLPTPLFTENETNFKRIFGTENKSPYVKDAFHEYLVNRVKEAINPNHYGTKAGLHYILNIPPGESGTVSLLLTDKEPEGRKLLQGVDNILKTRLNEADEFYAAVFPNSLSKDLRVIQRQAFAGMLWTKQFYYFVIEEWLKGDPAFPPPKREKIRNAEWIHLYNDDILSMPDKWEYPWFASWDTAFHTLPLAIIDPEFAKKQLMLLTREWYMHPNGQIPAYEWDFSDVNPPVHAWAAWRVYKIDKKKNGVGDITFLERVFQKLLLNFTWWVNRKDADGRNIFQGGFLGLDNISIFDRSSEIPTGGRLDQCDATSWMGMYCLNMLTIALELAQYNISYEDIASKFFEHFLHIVKAMSHIGESHSSLWDDADGFFYDVIHLPDGTQESLKVRSLIGLIPLFAVTTIESHILDKLDGFKKRFEWFLKNRKDLCTLVASMKTTGEKERKLLSIVDRHKLVRILSKMLDEKEFLSKHGIRSLSAYHKDHPYSIKVDKEEYHVDYEPAESATWLFGGNSNWRGPVWFPINYLIIESLQKFHHYLGDDFKVECPTGSGKYMNLWEVATEISRRLIRLFTEDDRNMRPIFSNFPKRLSTDPEWKNYILFYEYFNGDSGAGLGASHQTGWTGLVSKLIQQCGEHPTNKHKSK